MSKEPEKNLIQMKQVLKFYLNFRKESFHGFYYSA